MSVVVARTIAMVTTPVKQIREITQPVTTQLMIQKPMRIPAMILIAVITTPIQMVILMVIPMMTLQLLQQLELLQLQAHLKLHFQSLRSFYHYFWNKTFIFSNWRIANRKSQVPVQIGISGPPDQSRIFHFQSHRNTMLPSKCLLYSFDIRILQFSRLTRRGFSTD